MNKKLLVGVSAIAVVVLVLASLNPVVGFHSVKSNSFKDSPLFSTRLKNAINKGQDTLECNYIGKGSIMPFPRRDSNIASAQKVVKIISRMDEKRFNEFVKLVVYHFDKLQDVEPQEIIKTLHLLRTNLDTINDDFIGNGGAIKEYTSGTLCNLIFYWIGWIILLLEFFIGFAKETLIWPFCTNMLVCNNY